MQRNLRLASCWLLLGSACASAADQTITGAPVTGVVDAGNGLDDAGIRDAAPSQRDAYVAQPDASMPPLDPDACRKLRVLVRDFNASHPDFERFTSDTAYLNLVQPTLGADGKPVYAPPGGTAVSTGPAEFADWYHDKPGVNMPVLIELALIEEAPGLQVYDSDAFFPVDGKGFNQQTQGHNFSFTTEIHTSFQYNGGERFTFMGDDDLWLFINKKLAIDLGGTHPELMGSVSLDAVAATFGLEKGKRYDMDIFHAERHTPGSHFRLETSIECFVPII